MEKASGHRKADLMAAFKVDFVEGAQTRNINKKLASEIFDLLERFAQYGFNKSHSTAYALVAYQTAWLKAHYPAEFFTALLNSEINNSSTKYIPLKAEIEKLQRDIDATINNFELDDEF